MALPGISSDFDLDDHGILRDSFISEFHVDDDGILHDDLDLFKHAVNTAGHGTDSGIGGDKQSSTSTLQHLHASFDEDVAPIADESVNISDFEASRDDFDSFEGDLPGGRRSRSSRRYSGVKELETPGSTLERPMEYRPVMSKTLGKKAERTAPGEDQDLFTEDYYQQLRELGVLVDGADFSRDMSQTEFEVLETHLSREHIDYNGDNRDLIGEYLQDQYERERAEDEGDEMEERIGRNQSRIGASSRANSAPTISEHSFPEISPEDAEMMYQGSQQTGEDEEIYLINHQMAPGSSGVPAQEHHVTASEANSRPDNHSQAPHGADRRWHHSRSRRSPSPGVGEGQGHSKSRSETNTPHKTRPDSVASHVSFASDAPQPHSGTSDPGKALAKAHSQESFFEQDKPQDRSNEKVPKRLLPTPSVPDINQSFRVKTKSKSSSNIAGKATPIKPTHMSMSELSRVPVDQNSSNVSESMHPAGEAPSDRSEGELTNQLKHESSKRQQATELVQQLQKEYDSLLSKYALAELTIDQMRLGARVALHVDSPTPVSVQQSGAPPGSAGGPRKMHVMQLPTPSAQRAVVGQIGGRDGPAHASSQAQTTDGMSRPASRADDPLSGPYGDSEGGGQGAGFTSEDRVGAKTPRTAESLVLNIQTQATSLNDRLDQFHTLLENRQLTLEEQEKAFENIRTDHEKLRRSYLQAKEDYNVLKRSGAAEDFDNDKEVEGQLFRLGMKFDEVHEMVDSNIKANTSRRQPFQTSRLAQDEEEEEEEDQSSEQNQHHPDREGTGEDAEFEKRAEQLHEEYRALMDRYRRLKQMVPTPELNKETDNLVRKLHEICTEMPDMFRLAPELQDRFKEWKKTERLKLYDRLNNVYDRLNRRDQRRSPLPSGGGGQPGQQNGPPSVPASPKARGLPMVGDHSISPYLSGRQSGRDGYTDDNYHQMPTSLNGSRSIQASPVDRHADRDHPGSPSSLDGAAAPWDQESYDPRINRPRRHQHDFRDPKLSKMPERGSYSSLPDSGISDQDARDRRPRDEVLDRLPGPGKMKQLTHQRGDNDLDSGFIGSVVSADGAPRHRLPETPLRLRNQNRSRQNSTDSSSTVGSARQERSSERQPRPSRPPPTVPALVGINRSTDRSYDGELDESGSFSETHPQNSRSKTDSHSQDVRPKVLSARQGSSRTTSQRSALRGRRREEGSMSSTGTRSQQGLSRSVMRKDETLEDISDGEMTEASTPRHIDPAEGAQRRQLVQPSPRSAYRPPTPHQSATPRRPPTPYRAEEMEGDGVVEQEVMVPEVGILRMRPDEDMILQNRSHQRSSRSPAVPDPSTLPIQRPPSRGQPMTDLYHTRPRQGGSRERDRESIMSSQSSSRRPASRHSGRGGEMLEPIRGEERGVGSDAEIRSGSSINSGRLRALQDEIEKLKEGVKQVQDQAAQRPTPQPQAPPPPPQQEDPKYYDPFDDPYGFMRMPRRRANSFSGGRVREYDDWYLNGPNDKRTDDADIPLGYAAADAYNRHHRDKTPEAAHQRLRLQGDRRRRNEETQPQTAEEVNDVEGRGGVRTSAPPSLPSRLSPQTRRPPTTDPQALYSYYIPTRQGGQPALPNPNPNANPYRQHTTPLSASQPNLAGTLAGVEPTPYQHGTQPKRPWYTIRRSQWPASSSLGQYFPTLGYQARSNAQKPVSAAPPPAAQQPQVASYYSAYPPEGQGGGVGYRVETCPLCGGAGAHIHEDDVEPVQGYMAQDFATQPGPEAKVRSRQRSRSTSRSRHYTPERSSSQSRYLVREFGDSISDESDHDHIKGHRRSRSLSRTRSHSETRSSSGRSSSRQRGRRYRRDVDLYDSDDDVDLNESLGLSEDINRLTKRMMGTVQGELRRYRDRKEFGSSHW